jgi:hypothetical protein
MQIYNQTQVSPVDQHLYLDAVELIDREMTMSQLRIVPDAVLFFIADEAIGCDSEVFICLVGSSCH